MDRRQRLDSATRFTEDQVLAALRACTPPVLFIRALDSYFKMPPKVIDSRLAALPNVEYEEMAGGHHLHIESAELVAQTIERFLN